MPRFDPPSARRRRNARDHGTCSAPVRYGWSVPNTICDTRTSFAKRINRHRVGDLRIVVIEATQLAVHNLTHEPGPCSAAS